MALHPTLLWTLMKTFRGRGSWANGLVHEDDNTAKHKKGNFQQKVCAASYW